MLQNDESYSNNKYDFEEINSTINNISNVNFQPNQNMPNNNSIALSQKKRLILFLVGFSYTGLLLLSLIWSILLAPTSNGDIVFTQMMIEFLTYVSLFIFMFLICLNSKKHFANELRKPSNYGKGFLCGLLILGVEVLISYIIQLFYEPEANANQALVELLSTNYPTLMFLITCILGPICEELTYRVGLFGFLRQKNKILAYILEGFVFAFVHISFTDTTFLAELSAFPIYLAISFLLTYTYDKYGLSGSVVAHAFLNVFSFISIMLL